MSLNKDLLLESPDVAKNQISLGHLITAFSCCCGNCLIKKHLNPLPGKGAENNVHLNKINKNI